MEEGGSVMGQDRHLRTLRELFSLSVTPADLHGLETMVVTVKTTRENTSLQKPQCEENSRGKASRCMKAGGAERGV